MNKNTIEQVELLIGSKITSVSGITANGSSDLSIAYADDVGKFILRLTSMHGLNGSWIDAQTIEVQPTETEKLILSLRNRIMEKLEERNPAFVQNCLSNSEFQKVLNYLDPDNPHYEEDFSKIMAMYDSAMRFVNK